MKKAALVLMFLMAGCIRITNTVPPPPPQPDPDEIEEQPTDGEDTTDILIVGGQRGRGRGGNANIGDRVVFTGFQRIEVRCADAETRCVGVYVFIRPETGPERQREFREIAKTGTESGEHLFEMFYDTTDERDGPYQIRVYGCDTELDLTQEELSESEACTFVDYNGRIAN